MKKCRASGCKNNRRKDDDDEDYCEAHEQWYRSKYTIRALKLALRDLRNRIDFENSVSRTSSPNWVELEHTQAVCKVKECSKVAHKSGLCDYHQQYFEEILGGH